MPYLQGYEYRTDLIADTLLWGCCLAFVRFRLNAAISTTVAMASFALLVLPLAPAIGAAFVCAHLRYRFAEQPCIRFGRQMISRRPLVAAPEPV